MNQAQRGRILVLLVIAFVLGVSILVIGTSNLVTKTGNTPAQAVRFLITLFLCISLYYGRDWVRWLFVVLLSVSGVFAIGIAASLFSSNLAAVSFLIMGIVYVGCALVLALSSSVRMFLRYQRAGLVLTADPEDL